MTSRKFKEGRSYKSRNKNLKNLGYSTYRAYLASPLWKEIRERVFRHHGRLCNVCGRRATQVHHIRYGVADLTGVRLRFMRPICEGCHVSVEFTECGSKTTVAKAKKRYQKRREKLHAERSSRVISDQESRRRPSLSQPLWRLSAPSA